MRKVLGEPSKRLSQKVAEDFSRFVETLPEDKRIPLVPMDESSAPYATQGEKLKWEESDRVALNRLRDL